MNEPVSWTHPSVVSQPRTRFAWLKPEFTFTQDDLIGYLFISLLLVLFLLFNAWPVLRAFSLSFTDYKYLQPQGTHFVGLANYVEALTDDPDVLTALFLALIAAIPLDRISHRVVSGIYRTIFYLPIVMPSVVVSMLWKWGNPCGLSII